VRTFAAQVAGVRRVETLRLRKSGLEYFADIHIEVDADLTVAEGHHIGHRVKDALLTEFPAIRDVLVHIEPYPHPNYSHIEPNDAPHAADSGTTSHTG
jgi:divalent metal cation (Fe/Co/Zn/Cd) transporter